MELTENAHSSYLCLVKSDNIFRRSCSPSNEMRICPKTFRIKLLTSSEAGEKLYLALCGTDCYPAAPSPTWKINFGKLRLKRLTAERVFETVHGRGELDGGGGNSLSFSQYEYAFQARISK